MKNVGDRRARLYNLWVNRLGAGPFHHHCDVVPRPKRRDAMRRRVASAAGIAAILFCTLWVSGSAIAQVVGDPAPVPPKTNGLAGTYYNNTGNNATGLGPP